MMAQRAFSENELTVVRRAYARQMLALASTSADPRIEDAFASVRREAFLGPPPWYTSRGAAYRELPSADPALVYQDILIALSRERSVNNGSPSLHARWLGAIDIREGASVAHLGAGSGYYTAIIAHLAGKGGHVDAIEIDPPLADLARAALAGQANVSVACADALLGGRSSYDRIYVNFAVERPVRAWTESLSIGGRLIFPLGVGQVSKENANVRHSSDGAAFLVERRETGLAVLGVDRAWFICAERETGVSDAERARLKTSFANGGVGSVKSLHWDNNGPAGRDWHVGDGWRLSFDELDG